MTNESGVDRATLKAAHCWFTTDRVTGGPDVTAFRRRARLHQARWREAAGLPIGSHREGPDGPVPNGSRLGPEADAAANFLSPSIVAAVEARLSSPERHETLDVRRLRKDLLSSMPMCFNLFGDLHGSPERTVAAAGALWPDLDVVGAEVRFEWSPGRQEPRFTGDRTAFDAAFELTRADGSRGVVGIETKYHEHAVVEQRPDRDAKPGEEKRLPLYREITERSGVFVEDWEDRILGTDLQQVWRDHLLVLSMLQPGDPEARSFGRYVLVHPAGNPAFAEVGARYREVLADDATFEVRTIEDLIDAHVLHGAEVEAAFRRRYLFD